MFLRILRKDLKRKKTMNTILLIFIILASMFIASSANNILTITNALDYYFEKANIPDLWFVTTDKKSMDTFETFAKENEYDYVCNEMLQINPKDILVDGHEFKYSNINMLSTLDGTNKVFDSNDEEITYINDGELWITAEMFFSSDNAFLIDSEIEVTVNGITKTFRLKGYTKDAMFGSAMIGTTRFLVSENDLALFWTENAAPFYSVSVYTDDENYYQKYTDLELNTLFNVQSDMVGKMYIMDVLIAAIMLVVSICMILISMVILHFTIKFTISEEFCEIGVMKAIGFKCSDIRGIYIIKYLAIAVVGAAIGFIFSIPFGDIMLGDVSQRIMLSSTGGILLNFFFAVLVAGIVVFFCWNCTRRIKSLSPVDAIRKGGTGERFSRKSMLRLGKSHLTPVSFLAVNDIFSGIKRFISMILIFMLGLLLLILPINTINTLQSDNMITWFNMGECDHVILKEMLFSANVGGIKMMQDGLKETREFLAENEIEAEVFQEALFRMTISYNGKKTSSMAFQGLGDITADQYSYLEGTPPMHIGEVAITGMVAERIGAHIGDTVEIANGEESKQYMVTALFQSMNNLGEGIRFCQDEELDYRYLAGSFEIQIRYADHPDQETLSARKELLKELFPESEIYNPGEYINYMIGDVAGQIDSVKSIILMIVLVVNMLVTVLMVKSFITREKGEIAILKAIGFKNISLITWQSLRIGIVLLIAILLAIIVSTPLTQIVIGPIFQMMGAQTIEFTIIALQVYVFYPLLILGVTVLSGILAALQIRKIKASDTANIE